MGRKTNQFTVRLSDELFEELEKAAKATGLDEQEIAKVILRSFVQQINAGEKLEFPFRFVSQASAEIAPSEPAAKKKSAA